MGYKRIDQNMTFAEVSLLKSMEHNRSLKRLEKINSVIDWSQVEEILLSHYTVGSSREGADDGDVFFSHEIVSFCDGGEY